MSPTDLTALTHSVERGVAPPRYIPHEIAQGRWTLARFALATLLVTGAGIALAEENPPCRPAGPAAVATPALTVEKHADIAYRTGPAAHTRHKLDVYAPKG